jgi:hypothetical protein
LTWSWILKVEFFLFLTHLILPSTNPCH